MILFDCVTDNLFSFGLLDAIYCPANLIILSDQIIIAILPLSLGYLAFCSHIFQNLKEPLTNQNCQDRSCSV